MSAPVPQVWRLEVGRLAANSRFFLNGEQVYPSNVELRIEAGQRTTLHLSWPKYGLFGTEHCTPPAWHPRDQIIVVTDEDDRLFRQDNRPAYMGQESRQLLGLLDLKLGEVNNLLARLGLANIDMEILVAAQHVQPNPQVATVILSRRMKRLVE